jgi:tetratricopeptide (TPR) repeat protein
MYLISFNFLLIKTILLLFLSSIVFAETDINLQPMYGGIDRAKNPELNEQDNAFIASATRTFGTREHASEGYVERGFDNYGKNKLDKSMQRFNQAWLLDQNNPYAYLGFGLILKKQEKPCEAYEMFKLANKNKLNESGFLADYAYTTTQCALLKENNKRQDLFDTSNNLYEEAVQTPNNTLRAYVYHSWAKSYLLQENIPQTKNMIDQSRSLGGKIDNSLLEAVSIKSTN